MFLWPRDQISGLESGLADERIVRRHAAVIAKTQDLALVS